MIYKLNNVLFDINIPHKIMDVNYPAGFFNEASNRAMLGITEEPDPPLTPEQIAANLQAVKNNVWGQIKAERDRRKFGGVFVSGKWIHTDTYSRTQWLGMSMLGASLPLISWTTMDGSPIDTTPALASAVFQAVLTADNTNFTNAKNHKTAMEASPDPLLYNFSTGWTNIYLG